MKNLGVMEIFYGEPWSFQNRLEFAPLLHELGFEFYIYGPKGDVCLRQNWRRLPTEAEFSNYKEIRDTFKNHGLKFGLVLSPTELHLGFDQVARQALIDKVKALSELELDYLGLFFDDMPGAPDLAPRQLEIVRSVESQTPAKLIFCPTYYCHDPLLDMLFGEKPSGYLEQLGEGLAKNIEILWTGESIISQNITAEHLAEVTATLKRAPFLCDNFYADDGPIFSNFLKVIPPTGREREVFTHATHWAFNPMNQAHLSHLALVAISRFIRSGDEPDQALLHAVRQSVPGPLGELILEHAPAFAQSGLDEISAEQRTALIQKFEPFLPNGAALEIIRWLKGEYIVEPTF